MSNAVIAVNAVTAVNESRIAASHVLRSEFTVVGVDGDDARSRR
jgi:hypothetical protein